MDVKSMRGRSKRFFISCWLSLPYSYVRKALSTAGALAVALAMATLQGLVLWRCDGLCDGGKSLAALLAAGQLGSLSECMMLQANAGRAAQMGLPPRKVHSNRST